MSTELNICGKDHREMIICNRNNLFVWRKKKGEEGGGGVAVSVIVHSCTYTLHLCPPHAHTPHSHTPHCSQ